MPHSFRLVDVFGTGPFTGNPLAVVADAEGIDDATMQRITRWLNLSETVFLLPPTEAGADYRARIFTLERELPFAGHPTLGACHAWIEAGGVPASGDHVVQQCGVGLVEVRRDAGRLAFAAPRLVRSGPVDEERIAEIASVLRIDRMAILDAQWVDNGPGWLAVLLPSAEAVLAVEPHRSWPTRLGIGLVGFHPPGAEAAIEVRALFSDQHGALIEDPVTGSLNASVAQWLLDSGRLVAPYVAAQGTKLGRTGRVHVRRDPDGAQIWIGGRTHSLATGTLDPDAGE